MEGVLDSILKKVPSAENCWDAFQAECAAFHSRPASTLAELDARDDKKQHGDLWEHFCVRYLVHCRSARAAWLLPDVPAAVRAALSLGASDMGIDIVAVDAAGSYWAVQCKWRAPGSTGKARSYISWSQLSTFYALAARTGPYVKHLVLTNATGVRHVGARQPEDETVACGGFKKLARESWLRMRPASPPPAVLPSSTAAAALVDVQAVREARIKALTRQST
jgi:hypothetical protein